MRFAVRKKALHLLFVSYWDLKIRKAIITGIAAIPLLFGCGLDYSPQRSPVEVVLGLGEEATRTSLSGDGLHFVWDRGDELSLWAKNSEGAFALENQIFKNFASPDDHRGVAYFGATLPAPMPEGTYTYYLSYPTPLSVSGTSAHYQVPQRQAGSVSGGLDITVSEPVRGSELKPSVGAGQVENGLRVRMKHLLHFLKFYIPEGDNILGEPVTKIEFSMPQAVAGEFDVDVTDASVSAIQNGASGITMVLGTPLDESPAGARQYAVAAIFPPQNQYKAGENLQVTMYSANRYSVLSFDLAGRSFEAGHITGVPLRPGSVLDRPRYLVDVTLDSNNLGEDLQGITLSLPDGVNWPGTSSNIYKYSKPDGSLLAAGDSFRIDTVEESEFRAISGQPVAVRYESESAVLLDTLALADLSSVAGASLGLDCPYLFFEDFSGVESFSSHDEYAGSSAGSYSPHTFLDGWSAARAGAREGTAIRLACRRETRLANYSARADSPFISGLKEGKTVDLSVQFDYSMAREGKPKISQTVLFGFIKVADNFKSGSDEGTFPVSFTVNETTGSYSNINNSYTGELNGVGAPLRLSWRTIPETNWGANNNTCWLYIDNIKVKIKK